MLVIDYQEKDSDTPPTLEIPEGNFRVTQTIVVTSTFPVAIHMTIVYEKLSSLDERLYNGELINGALCRETVCGQNVISE